MELNETVFFNCSMPIFQFKVSQSKPDVWNKKKQGLYYWIRFLLKKIIYLPDSIFMNEKNNILYNFIFLMQMSQKIME